MKNKRIDLSFIFTLLFCCVYAENIPYYIVPSLELPEKYMNYPGSNSEPYKLEMAKGENEHIQLVFNAQPGEKYTITREIINNEFDFQTRELCFVKEFEDALVPRKDFISIKNEQTVIWISYFSKRDIAAGIYGERIKLACGEKIIEVLIDIHIKDVLIPLRPSIPSEFCVDLTKLPYGGSDEQKELWTEMLLDYRMDPYFARIIDPSIRKWENCYSPWEWNDPRSKELLKDERYARYALPNYTLTDEELGQMMTEIDALSLLERSYFYIWDEPIKTEYYQKISDESKRIRAISPKANILTTFHMGAIDGPNPGNLYATLDYFKDQIQIYPIAQDYFQANESESAKCREKIEPAEYWNYVCWKPDGKEPNFLFGMNGCQNRAIMWRIWKDRCSGFLYWGVNMYKSLNPFEFDRSLAVGDGILIYPGSLFAKKEPIASVRLELWRDGQEDYELLYQLENKRDRDLAERLLSTVYKNPVNLTSNEKEVREFKSKILTLLENNESESSSTIIINGTPEIVDTLNHYLAGPGNYYTQLRFPDLPLDVHVMKLDLHDPYMKIHTFLSNDKIDGTEKITKACERISASGYDAYCGINGDFFNITAHNEKPLGAPRGGCVGNGIVHREPRSIDWGFAALDENNIPIIDYMEFVGTVTCLKPGIGSYKFNDVNIPRSDHHSNDLTFFNEFCGGATRMDENANIGDNLKTEVFIKLQAGQEWSVNNLVKCEVVRIIANTEGNNKLNPGECALSGIGKAKDYLDKLQPGFSLNVKMGIRTKSNDNSPVIKEMIGGNTILMQNGKLDPSNFLDSYNTILYPRTGVGASDDGHWLYFMVVDGRSSLSRGVTTAEMCDIFKAIGATEVVGMDGGGSSGMVVNKKIVNKPSDGVERSVANGWLVVSQAPEETQIFKLEFGYLNLSALKYGQKLKPTVLGYNRYDVLLESNIQDAILTCDASLGHIDSDKNLILDGSEGKGYIRASYDQLEIHKFININQESTQIKNSVENDLIKVYPTKICDGVINVYLKESSLENVILELYDTSGMLLKKEIHRNSTHMQLRIDNQQSGIFLLKVISGKKSYIFNISYIP